MTFIEKFLVRIKIYIQEFKIRILNNIKPILHKFTNDDSLFFLAHQTVNQKKIINELKIGNILDESIKTYKKSDTLFIMGCGPSINEISDQDFENISKHDSIGFNLFSLKKFRTTFYSWQTYSVNWLRYLNDNIDYFRDMPILLRFGSHSNSKDSNNNLSFLKNNKIYYLHEFPIVSASTIDPMLLMNFTKDLGILEFNKISKIIPKFKTSIGIFMPFAYQMGYKKIVLCGIDLKETSTHFYDTPDYENELSKYYYNRVNYQNTEKYFTDRKFSKYITEDYVNIMSDFFHKENKVKTYVFSKSSALYPSLPLYNFDK